MPYVSITVILYPVYLENVCLFWRKVGTLRSRPACLIRTFLPEEISKTMHFSGSSHDQIVLNVQGVEMDVSGAEA